MELVIESINTMKMKIVNTPFFLILISIFFSCKKENGCLKTSGNTIVENRQVTQSFNYIELNNKINLIITQDSVYSLKVEAGENLMPLIFTEINANKLSIRSDNRCSFLRDYKKPINVYISTPDIKEILYKGYGNISATNLLNFPDFTIQADGGTGTVSLSLNSNEIKIKQHAGPADFRLSGQTNDIFLYTNGSGWIYAEKVAALTGHVSSNGTGDVFVNSKDELRVEIRHIGNVNYYGNPVINVTEQSGSGKIIKK